METKDKTKGVGGNGNLIPCKKGETNNPNGRPKGQRNYSTIYREALLKIGESENMTPEQIEEVIEKSRLLKAMEGDLAFQKDILDRVHGKPKQDSTLDLTTGGEKLEGFVINFGNAQTSELSAET